MLDEPLPVAVGSSQLHIEMEPAMPDEVLLIGELAMPSEALPMELDMPDEGLPVVVEPAMPAEPLPIELESSLPAESLRNKSKMYSSAVSTCRSTRTAPLAPKSSGR